MLSGGGKIHHLLWWFINCCNTLTEIFLVVTASSSGGGMGCTLALYYCFRLFSLATFHGLEGHKAPLGKLNSAFKRPCFWKVISVYPMLPCLLPLLLAPSCPLPLPKTVLVCFSPFTILSSVSTFPAQPGSSPDLSLIYWGKALHKHLQQRWIREVWSDPLHFIEMSDHNTQWRRLQTNNSSEVWTASLVSVGVHIPSLGH